jgi:allantoinase
VRGARLATAPDAPVCDIGIADGRIVALEPELAGGAAEEIDAHGLHALAGGVDPHVHLNEPGRTHWEGVGPGTSALAVGGVTTAVEMPLNASPPTIDAASFDAKREAVEREARIDLALWGGLVPRNLEHLPVLAERGVVGFKAFMCHGGLDDFPPCDDLTLLEGMTRSAELGLPVAVHAESEAITAGLGARARAAGRTAMRDFLASRPVVAELEAIGRAILLAEEAGCALHVVHVSSGRGVALVAEARARGLDVTCEVCPHHLLLDEGDAERLGAIAKCAPPLRGPEERAALWEALAAGDVAIVASDHSPSPPSLKRGDDAFAAWGGIAGAQSSLELLLTDGVHAGRIALATIAELFAAAAARRLRLPGKGALELGFDADLALVDVGGERVLRAEDLRSRHRVSPYVGRTLRARVVRTLVRGETVAEAGRVVGQPRGRLLRPAASRRRA